MLRRQERYCLYFPKYLGELFYFDIRFCFPFLVTPVITSYKKRTCWHIKMQIMTLLAFKHMSSQLKHNLIKCCLPKIMRSIDPRREKWYKLINRQTHIKIKSTKPINKSNMNHNFLVLRRHKYIVFVILLKIVIKSSSRNSIWSTIGLHNGCFVIYH